MLNAVSNLFDYHLPVETTWLDLPVSFQNYVLTGLQSALFKLLPLFTNFNYYCVLFSVVFISVLYIDITSILPPRFFYY